MEHAIRSHIRKHTDEDPVLYRKLSERLNDILQNAG
jgi:type I restriction enzyme R subunit